jgi:hypothetical protein
MEHNAALLIIYIPKFENKAKQKQNYTKCTAIATTARQHNTDFSCFGEERRSVSSDGAAAHEKSRDHSDGFPNSVPCV